MFNYKLDVKTKTTGAHFNSIEIDLLYIVGSSTHEELITFVKKCYQIKHFYIGFEVKDFFNYNLDVLKRNVFKTYQSTLLKNNATLSMKIQNILDNITLLDKDEVKLKNIINTCTTEEDIYNAFYTFLSESYDDDKENLLNFLNYFNSIEKNQIKNNDSYELITGLFSRLNDFDSLVIDSPRYESIVTKYSNYKENFFKFDLLKKDLDFAKKYNKAIKYHTLLTKEMCEYFSKYNKVEIIDLLKQYIKASIDFINDYNKFNKLSDGTNIIKTVVLFNELVSFNKNVNNKHFNIWEKKHNINLSDLLEIFEYAIKNKPDGVSYIYNESNLENRDKRIKILSLLKEINTLSPNLIDTIGSQMHLTFSNSIEDIRNCFIDLNKLNETNNINIEITEFDLSLNQSLVERLFKSNDATYTPKFIKEYKEKIINSVSNAIMQSNARIKEISYWTLCDTFDHNLERIKSNFRANKLDNYADILSTVYSGLYTDEYLKKNNSE